MHTRLDASLPNLSRDNWKSIIRRYARHHPGYRDKDPWSGVETADITYTDAPGALTDLLVDKGHLSSRH
jgi:hypothetical protein